MQAAAHTIVFLGGKAPALDEHQLTEAVAIYTRDLGLELEVREGAPEEVTGDSLGAVIALVRATGVRLAFWYRRDPPDAGDVVLYGIANDGGHQTVHALRVGGASRAEIYRVLAIKVRAVLTGADQYETHEPTPAPTLPTPVAAPLPPPAPAIRPSLDGAPAKTPSTAYRARARIAVGYVATLPLSRLIRHGMALDAALLLGRRWELHLGFDVSSSSAAVSSAGSATLFEVPLWLGARVGLHLGRWAFAVGPLLSLHVLSLAATGTDGTRGSTVTAAAGLGGDLVGRLRITDHIGVESRFWAEEVIPDVQALLRGVKTLNAGGPIFGLVAAVSFGVP